MSEDPRTFQQTQVGKDLQKSQGPIPYWMMILTAIVYSVALILSLPLFGNRHTPANRPSTFLNKTHTRPWIDYGTVAGAAYLGVGFYAIYYMMMIRPKKRKNNNSQFPEE
jgi:hypothetical protein